MNKKYRDRLAMTTYKRQLSKSMWSIMIFFIVMTSNNIDSEWTNKFSLAVRKTLDYDLRLNDKRILKMVKTITAFNIVTDSDEYMSPIQGTLYKKFNDTKTGIDVLVYEEFVKSVGSGEIIRVAEKDDGLEVVISHGNLKSVYGRMKKSNVKKGEKVTKGHIIGSMGEVTKENKYLHFEMWENKSRVDPLTYIKVNDKIPLSYQ